MATIALSNAMTVYPEYAEELHRLGHLAVPFRDLKELRQCLSKNALDLIMDVNYHPEFQCAAAGNNIPYASWCLDSRMSNRMAEAQTEFRPEDKFFFFSQQDVVDALKLHDQVSYLPLSAGERFIRLPRREGFDADVTVVMNSYIETSLAAEADLAEMINQAQEQDPILAARARLAGELGKLIVEQHLNLFSCDRLAALLQNSITSCGVNPFIGGAGGDRRFLGGVGQILSCRQRELCIRTLAEMGCKLRVYGDPYWEKVLTGYKHVDFCGMADYGALPDIYNGARIGLNLTQIQNLDTVPQRIFHLLASGTLVLTNGGTALTEMFIPNEHLATFSEKEGLRQQLWRFLQDDNLRYRVASAGHQEFMSRHRLKGRLTVILQSFGL